MKTAAVLAAVALLLPGPALAQVAPAACPVVADHLETNGGLVRSRAAVARGRLTILAMGSSSIEGVGASRPDLSFVALLETGLERRLPGVEVTVVNRGKGGETTRENADRLQADVAAARPDLVLWQAGTNDVLRDRPEKDVLYDLRRGEAILDAADVDVLMVDPQRLREEATNPMFRGRNPMLDQTARLIDAEARRAGYAIFRRFDAMADWAGLERGGIGPDDLHLNDQGHACWAEVTAEGLAAALR